MPQLLFASRDPGSANMLAAFCWMLENKDLDVVKKLEPLCRGLTGYGLADLRGFPKRVFAWGAAREVWQRCIFNTPDLTFLDHETRDVSAMRVEVSQLMEAANSDLILLTGLDDVDGVRGRLFWEEARRLGGAVIALADNDKNISIRLTDASGSRFLPDQLLIHSDAALADVLHLGRNFVRLGPNFHILRTKNEAVDHYNCRPIWGVRETETVILFVSLVGREMRNTGRSVDFDEVVLLRRLIDSLKNGRFEDSSGPEIDLPRLVVRPHPREDITKFEWLSTAALPFPVLISAEGAPADAILSADWVVGINCAMLEEAEARGIPTHFLSSNGLD